MRLNTILAPLTIGMFVLTVVIVVDHIRTHPAAAASSTAVSITADPESEPSASRSLLSGSKSLLVTGVSSRIPEATDYRQLKTVPWESSEVGRLFRDAGVELSCQLLETGADVVQPLLEPTPNLAGPLGRQAAFSIRLQIGKNLGAGLPSVTRGIIEDYLKSHQLTIQPSYYHDEQGHLILGPRLRAAFVRLDVPDKTTAAESMIAASIAELRPLGAYWNSAEVFSPAACRTLLLGFRYTLDVDSLTGAGNPKREYELLFLHLLPESTVSNPRLAVFATSEARTQFHLLEENDPNSTDQFAAITADIRFADTRLAGMYPQAPVVTRVHHRALLSIPVDLVKSQIEGLAGNGPEGGFSGILDDLYHKATGTEAPAATPAEQPAPGSADVKPDAAETRPDPAAATDLRSP